MANRRPLPWRILHWIIILNFVAEILYASIVIFVVLAPPGGGGPLGFGAAAMPFEKMVTRRLYAIEAWLAMGGLSLYLAVTEVAPRFWWRENHKS